MSRAIILIPGGTRVGLTSISLGLIRAMERKSVRLSVFKTIAQFFVNANEEAPDKSINVVHKDFNIPVVEPLKMSYVESLLSNNKKDVLMEEIIANYHANSQDAEVVLIEGLVPTSKHLFAQSLNFEIAKTLNAEIVFVISQGIDTLEQLRKRIELIRSIFGGPKNRNIAGVIVNKLNAPLDEQGYICPGVFEILEHTSKMKVMKFDQAKFRDSSPLPVLGAIPWNFDFIDARAIDIARHLNATVINEGDIETRRVKSVTFCTSSIQNMLKHFCAGSLLVTSQDRPEVLIASCLAAVNGVEIGAILLTDGYEMDANISKLCERALGTGLPIFKVNTNTWQTSLNLQNFNPKIPLDDHERIKKVQEYVANHINVDWIESLKTISERSRHFSPPAFRYHLTKLARKAGKRIVLPEGSEPRTVKAAAICAERGIATCVLLGDSEEINRVAISQEVKLGRGIEIIDPKVIRENYVSRLVELRKKKGMTENLARKELEDNVVLGTLMLEQSKVDGLVSGAIHTTANTIRPSLQLIKTAPGTSLVSSVFFMLFPEQVYVYGDCAINLNPTAEQLAEIAIQSADSAIFFGIEPRVAMLSYSTGASSSGSDVEKVREATCIAQKKRPDLMIDGPLQYDAAVVDDVAKSKAPNSPVAGHATVFIFPDLNTGNTTYKAVQRSANLISIGPMLQGMRKPVNDLSRGALVDDIVYTIALTAIQSSQQQ